MTKNEKKLDNQEIFHVLDTNAVINDPDLLTKFKEHHIVLPLTVFDELDSLKERKPWLKEPIKSFYLNLDAIRQGVFAEYYSLGPSLGELYVENRVELLDEVRKKFIDDKPDHRILSSAIITKQNHPDAIVKLITDDHGLQEKALSFGIIPEYLRSNEIKDTSVLNAPIREMSKEEANSLEKKQNSCWILDGRLQRWNQTEWKDVSGEQKVMKVSALNLEQKFAVDVCLDPLIRTAILTGRAGTGKTLLAIATGLHLVEKGVYEEIYITRPNVEVSDKTVGFLPGSDEEKAAPYLHPIYDNIKFIRENCTNFIDEKRLHILPFSFIRGRTFPKAIIIVDESQNLSPLEAYTIISRLGKGSKMIFTGDRSQVDCRYLHGENNGLVWLIDLLDDDEEMAHIHLKTSERDPFVDKVNKKVIAMQQKFA